MFGNKTKQKTKKKTKKPKMLFFITNAVFLSTKINIKKLNTKYKAAYFARNANPKKTPNNIKLINESSNLVSKSFVIDSVQNNNSNRSVEIKNDETLAAGIIKKLIEQRAESLFVKFSCKHNL